MSSEIHCGDAIKVLKEMIDKESIDTVYMCPSPFGYYENNPEKVGGEPNISSYVENLTNICDACEPVLKKSGNLFVQVPDVFTPLGNLASIPSYFEMQMVVTSGWTLNDRIIWHRTEKNHQKKHKEGGFLKNFEVIYHFVKDENQFYFNENSKYAKTSVFSYPLEDSYYTNEFDSGLPEQLTQIIIDTTVPKDGTILDPLAGSGKVGVVAKKMNRNYILIDIDPGTVELMRIRLGVS